MKKYLFNPYRGIYYEDGINRTGIKVLVVGDSHYCKGGCNESDRDLCLKNPFEKKICSVDDSFLCDYNMDNIYYYLKDSSDYKTYIRLSSIFLQEQCIGKNENEESQKDYIGSHIAYTNYLQKILPTTNSTSKNYDFSNYSFDMFISALKVIQPLPDLLFLIGNNVRGAFTENMANLNKHLQPISGVRNKEWLFRGRILDKDMIFCVLKHPGWKHYSKDIQNENIERFKEALKNAKEVI